MLYGGSAGGGKSSALLAAAAQYVDVPGYSALLLRRSFPELMAEDGLIPRSREWWGGKAEWRAQERKWVFPSGAVIAFSYLDSDDHLTRFQSSAYQFVGFDELTHQPQESRYTYLFSRLRKPATGPLSAVPIRMRAATNPGGPGGEWVKQRFIPSEYLRANAAERFGRIWAKDGRAFVPAHRADNPYLDQEEYTRSLAMLPPLLRAQLDHGDWTAHADGHFKASWFPSYTHLGDGVRLQAACETAALRQCLRFAAVDPAGGTSEHADYTAIIALARTPRGNLAVLDVVRERIPVEEIVQRVWDLCRAQEIAWIAWEDAFLQSAYIRQARAKPGMPTIYAIDPGGRSKLVRATPAILRAEQGQIYLPDHHPRWLEPFLAELCAFTGDPAMDGHDDQVDALAYAILALDRFGLGSRGPQVGARGARGE